MKRFVLAAAAVAGLGFATSAVAQNFPMMPGDYVEMTSVTIDDGHIGDYAGFLATKWRAQEDFAKSQGWITSYEILGNADKRAGEPDLYLVEFFPSMPNAAEQMHRDQIMRDHVKMDDTAMDADSATRAKFRHITGSQLLRVLAFK